eukprot:PhM_4_TR14961/c0_g1_i1/m.68588
MCRCSADRYAISSMFTPVQPQKESQMICVCSASGLHDARTVPSSCDPQRRSKAAASSDISSDVAVPFMRASIALRGTVVLMRRDAAVATVVAPHSIMASKMLYSPSASGGRRSVRAAYVTRHLARESIIMQSGDGSATGARTDTRSSSASTPAKRGPSTSGVWGVPTRASTPCTATTSRDDPSGSYVTRHVDTTSPFCVSCTMRRNMSGVGTVPAAATSTRLHDTPVTMRTMASARGICSGTTASFPIFGVYDGAAVPRWTVTTLVVKPAPAPSQASEASSPSASGIRRGTSTTNMSLKPSGCPCGKLTRSLLPFNAGGARRCSWCFGVEGRNGCCCCL